MIEDHRDEVRSLASGGSIPTLDGWRALSIGAVLATHSLRMMVGKDVPVRGDPEAIGVAVFFCLSGLLITTLLIGERAKTGTIDLRSFYVRRAFRILPPALLFLAVLWLLDRAGRISVTTNSFVACLTFWRWAFNGDWYSGHFWSLSIEEDFYLVWPALLLIAATSRRSAVMAAGLIVLFWEWTRIDFLPKVMGFPHYWSLFILFGGLAALIAADPKWNARLRRVSGTPATLLVLAILLLSYYRTSFVPRRMVAPASISLLLLSTVLAPASLISRLLDLAPLRWVGRLSYSVYLWQQVFLVDRDSPDPFSVAGHRHPVLALLAIFGVACASRYLVEKPCINLGRALAAAGGDRQVRPVSPGALGGMGGAP
jgi:peptidoglycan/LPS O-acetylase OafA/YrhL